MPKEWTNTPRRRIRMAIKQAWKCACGKTNPYYWRNCPSCGERRPEVTDG